MLHPVLQVCLYVRSVYNTNCRSLPPGPFFPIFKKPDEEDPLDFIRIQDNFRSSFQRRWNALYTSRLQDIFVDDDRLYVKYRDKRTKV